MRTLEIVLVKGLGGILGECTNSNYELGFSLLSVQSMLMETERSKVCSVISFIGPIVWLGKMLEQLSGTKSPSVCLG